MKHDLPSFAVLIDADNVRLDSISPILEEITRHGRVTVRRIYGDFTSQNLAGWKTKLAEHAIHPIQQYRNTTGKNASDSALIIDAMDLLHSRRFEGFCLVSSDSDFTRLAGRIREDGLVVFGFGEKKVPKAFVNACDRYIYVENLLDGSLSEQNGDGKIVESLSQQPVNREVPLASIATSNAPENVISVAPASVLTAAPKSLVKSPAEAVQLLQRAYTNVADEQGWAMVGQVSSYIHANNADFDPRSYGCGKFIDLIQKTEIFELVQRAYKNGQSYFCRPTRSTRVNVSKPGVSRATKAQPIREALAEAVNQATANNGWAPISTIGQKLKALGRTVKESGCSTLTEALDSTSLFDMKGSGAGRYFRLKALAKTGSQ